MWTPASTRVAGAPFRLVGAMVAVAVVLVLLLMSHSFGRAEPTNNYRPPMTTDAIESGCYPLPGNAHFDGLAYQVRRDRDVSTDVGPRRRLLGQYDLVDRDEAERALIASFVAVGFHVIATDGGPVILAKGAERIGLRVTTLPHTSAETLVRGEFELDLPVVALARPDDPICDSSASTKRRPDVGLNLLEPLPWQR